MCYGWASGRASVPPGMDSCVVSIRRRCWLVGACRVVQLRCYELHEGKHHGCSRSTAWRRHLQLAEQLECCCGCAWRRATRGVPPTTVEAAQRRSSVGLGLGRARSIDLPGLGALDAHAPPTLKEVSPTSYRSMAAANVDLSAAAVAAPSPARPPRLAGSVPRARLQACEAAPTAARAAQRGCCR